MTVRNYRPASIEKIQYITPDGVIFDLHTPPDRSVIFIEGDGLPSLGYSTTRGPFQHGLSVIEARLDARNIDLIIRQNACDRDSYWELRTFIDGLLRANRTDINNPSPGVLRRVLSNGVIRDIDCYVTKGPLYKGSDSSRWDEYSIQEGLRFTAFNPIWYDPEILVNNVGDFTPNPPNVQQLVFPFSFPFAFDLTYTIVTKTISIGYNGNWEEYPTFEIRGPITNLVITHQELGAVIDFTPYEIPGNTTITIDLSYSRKTILDNFGVSWIGRITEESDLTAFRIESHPIVPNGQNNIDFSGILGDGSTSMEIQYKNRYVGVD